MFKNHDLLKPLRAGIVLLLLLSGSSSWAASHHPQEFLKQIAGSKDEGEQIVQHFCANCHAEKPLIPLGAPQMGVADDWQPRVTKGLDGLFKSTEEGINAMPAMGGCFECSDKQVMLAILAMLPDAIRKDLVEK